MTCRGYDAKAVKISKQVKRTAAQYLDPHLRGAIIRSFVEIEKSGLRSARKDKDSK